MTIVLDHLIVPAHDPVASARFLAELLGVPWEAARGHFTPVYVNETLTLDFAARDKFDSHHYCFRVSDAEFDDIFGRITATEAGRAQRLLDGRKSAHLGDPDRQLRAPGAVNRQRFVTPPPHPALSPDGGEGWK